MTYERAVAMCEDLGIPTDKIDDVIDIAQLCPCGDEGACEENSVYIIENEAKKYQ